MRIFTRKAVDIGEAVERTHRPVVIAGHVNCWERWIDMLFLCQLLGKCTQTSCVTNVWIDINAGIGVER